jgi:prepilin-type N-terminal cleavage/methylation domain-containing protein
MRALIRRRRAFTLIELLVVVTIVLLVAVIAIPVLSTLNGKQVTDGARILTGSLVGARDSAVRYNQPRGVRLLPDPLLTIPPPGQPGAGTIQLCYNRMIPIEPAGDFSQGTVTIGPYYYPGQNPTNFPPPYPRDTIAYPYPDSSVAQQAWTTQVLMIEECPYRGGYIVDPASPGEPRAPTNWYWNIRVGDKIKVNSTGRAYTIVGPCTVNPWATVASGNQGNPELFVNVGAPGSVSPLQRTYYGPDPTATPPLTQLGTKLNPEFLFVVNGEDDDGNGYADEGWDGFNQNPPPPIDANHNLFIDEVSEWEKEKWVGSLLADTLVDAPLGTPPTQSPSPLWAFNHYQKGTQDAAYIIERRPVPSEGSREIALSANMVIDATAWNSTRERSRLPIQEGSLHCDIMVNPSGLYIPTTMYSTPTSASGRPFLHFWLTDRTDVYPRGSIWGMTGTAPNPNPSNTTSKLFYELPMSSNTPSYPPNATAPVLKADRRLVTMFAQSGLVVTNTIDTIAAPSTLAPGEGFDVTNVDIPFVKAEQGLREAR